MDGALNLWTESEPVLPRTEQTSFLFARGGGLNFVSVAVGLSLKRIPQPSCASVQGGGGLGYCSGWQGGKTGRGGAPPTMLRFPQQ